MYTSSEVLYNSEVYFANNMDPDQTAPSGLIGFASTIISSLSCVKIVKTINVFTRDGVIVICNHDYL